MNAFLERVRKGPVLVADGAMGTMLQARGLPVGAAPESMNLDHPEIVQQIGCAFIDAGAQMIETNTFGGSPLKLAMHGLENRMEAINRNAVEAARRAAGGRAYVAGSCGPCGRLLEPLGDVSAEDLADGFRRQIGVLADAGVDVLCIETMTDLTEATLAVRAAREVAPDLPVLATMTFDASPQGYCTIMGVSVEAAAAGLVEAGADVIGSNCGNGSAAMIEIARAFRARSGLPLLIQPNAGLPRQEGASLVYPETPEQMADAARALVEAGAEIVGGCCGTTPEHIRAVREAVGECG
jgi:5-methyltetrahydrofolate--homocysteine methyltransferase